MNAAHLIFFWFNRGHAPPPSGLVANPAYTLLCANRGNFPGHVDGSFPAQSPEETLNFAFDLETLLGAGETVSSVTWLCAASQGTDADAQARIGQSAIDGTVIIVNVTPGLAGVTYRLTAKATTGRGQLLVVFSHCQVIAPD